MFRLDNYGGTLYNKEIPLMKFKFKDDVLVSVERLCTNEKLFPYELYDTDLSDRYVRLFFEMRTTSSNRQGLRELLKEHHIPYYSPEFLLRYCKARTCDDKLWVEPDSDTTSLVDEIEHEYWSSFIGGSDV